MQLFISDMIIFNDDGSVYRINRVFIMIIYNFIVGKNGSYYSEGSFYYGSLSSDIKFYVA